jgi:hypothetical protein
MSSYFVGCCSTAVTTFYGSASLFSYDTGVVSDTVDGGVDSVRSSPVKISVGAGKTTITLAGLVDDLGMIIPPGSAVSFNYNLSNSTANVTIPVGAVIIAPTSGNFTYKMIVTDGTHTVTIPASTIPSAALTLLNASGLTVAQLATPISLSSLQSHGIADANGNLTFDLLLIPSGQGQLHISSVTAA